MAFYITDLQATWMLNKIDGQITGANNTFAIGGFSCSADSFVIAESSVLRTNFCGEKPTHRKSAKR